MKKVICFLLSAILIFALVGCNSGKDSNNSEENHIEESSITYSKENNSSDLDDSNLNKEVSDKSNESNTNEKSHKYPTIEQFMTSVKSKLGSDAISGGSFVDGKYKFYFNNIEIALVLDENNDVVNAAFVDVENWSANNDMSNLIIGITGLGASFMLPLCEHCESEEFDIDTVCKEVNTQILEKIKENNSVNYNVDYKFGMCSLTISAITTGSSTTFIVATGYKK